MIKLKERISGIPRGIFLAAVFFLILAVIFICISFLYSDKIPYEKNRKTVAALASADIAGTEQKLQALYEEEHPKRTSEGPLTKVEMQKIFKNSVILGDSFSESIVEYGYLGNDVVLYQRGISVSAIDELVKRAIGLNPAHVFMEFGSNDLENDVGNSQQFVDDYKKQIQQIKTALPNAAIYVNCILPVSEEAIAQEPNFSYYPQFNEALKAMCVEQGCTFIDSSSLVLGQEGIYEPDGIHMVESYYPGWLTMLADTAGL